MTHLPPSGVVNLVEAQAVLRYAEAHADVTAVASLQPAQATLLRLLAAKSPGPVRVRVLDGPAGATAEPDVLLVSLVRSHRTFAVGFSDEPAGLPDVLGRARRRLILAGDPGCLDRRAKWDAPLPGQDEAAGRAERTFAAAVLRCPRVAPAPARIPEGART